MSSEESASPGAAGRPAGTVNLDTIIMTQDASVTANFELAQFEVYLPLVVKR